MTYGANYSDIAKNNCYSSYNLFITDHKIECNKPTIYLVDNIANYRLINQNLIKRNFNFDGKLTNATSILTEDNLIAADKKSTDKSIFTDPLT